MSASARRDGLELGHRRVSGVGSIGHPSLGGEGDPRRRAEAPDVAGATSTDAATARNSSVAVVARVARTFVADSHGRADQPSIRVQRRRARVSPMPAVSRSRLPTVARCLGTWPTAAETAWRRHMRRPLRAVAGLATAILIFGACSTGGTPAPSTGGESPAGGASPSAGGSAAAPSSAWDPQSVTGTVVLSGLAVDRRGGRRPPGDPRRLRGGVSQHHPRLPAGRDRLPDGDGRQVQRRRAAGPVLRRLERLAPDWIDQGVLQELDTMAAERGFDTSQFFPGYLDAFKGTGRQDLRLPEGRQHAGDGLQRRHARGGRHRAADQLGGAPGGRRGADDRRPEGLLPEPQPRPGARLHLPERRLAPQRGQDPEHRPTRRRPRTRSRPISASSRTARAPGAGDLGDDWCGKALGEEQVAIIFEGGWLDPYMSQNYPDVNYEWAEMPTGTEKATLGFTVELLDRRRLGEQGPGVGPAPVPDRPRGHDQVDGGRRRQPVPQGRPGRPRARRSWSTAPNSPTRGASSRASARSTTRSTTR